MANRGSFVGPGVWFLNSKGGSQGLALGAQVGYEDGAEEIRVQRQHLL